MNLAKSKLVAFHSMKVLACFLCFLCFLLSLGIISLTHAAEELFWTPVLLSEPITFGVARFKGELGWMNTGKQLWITHDSGRNWRISLTGPLRDIYFVDDLEGWAIADRNVLFHTSDGGTTWQTVEFELIRTSTELLLEGLLVSIYFKDSLHGLGVFAMQKIQGGFAIIARTDDGGKHWREVWIHRGAIFAQSIGIGEQVWIYENDIGKALLTTNFGEDFRELPRSLIFPDFLPSTYGWMVDYSSLGIGTGLGRWEVLATSDGGFTWSSPILSLQGPFARIHLYPCLLGERIGAALWLSPPADSGLYLTLNGGETWSRYNVPIESGYQLACNRERQELWLIPRSKDGGRNVLFRASISGLTAIKPLGKLPISWGVIKQRKEF